MTIWGFGVGKGYFHLTGVRDGHLEMVEYAEGNSSVSESLVYGYKGIEYTEQGEGDSKSDEQHYASFVWFGAAETS